MVSGLQVYSESIFSLTASSNFDMWFLVVLKSVFWDVSPVMETDFIIISECLVFVFSLDPKAETRLYVTVNGFEFHVYNRTDLYARLQETFGLEPTLLTPKKDEERGEGDRTLERCY